MSRVVVIFGPPGCGKGTQAARLKDALSVPHISTGDMFRDHKTRKTDLGKKVQAIMDAGGLVPDQITNEMVRERLGRPDVVKQGALLDGYPRNVPQAQELDGILRALEQKVESVVVIEVPNDELMKRLLARGKDSGRADDQDPNTIQRRLDAYGDQSHPCIEYYERQKTAKVHKIQGTGTIDEVTKRILGALGVKARS